MPRNGEINQEFGVYKNLCCGSEIIIPEGVTFPDCPRHFNLTTECKFIADTERIPHAGELRPKRPA